MVVNEHFFATALPSAMAKANNSSIKIILHKEIKMMKKKNVIKIERNEIELLF